MRPSTLARLRAAAACAGFVALCAYPIAVTNPYYARIGGLVLLSAISASAWNIVGGYAGQVSIGHSMFFGLGAYLPLVLYSNWQLPPTLGVPMGILLAVFLAVLVGFPAFRLQGHYFSMATIAVAELIRLLVSNWDLFGAAIGVRGPAVSRTVWDFAFRSVIPYYYLFLAGLAAVLGTTRLIERSRMGYYLRAIKSGEGAARSLGVPSRRYKLYALMVSAAFASLAGSFYALWIGFADTSSALGILVSVEMVIVTALGGAGTLYGPLIGALILIPLQNFSNVLFGAGGTGLTFLMYGGIIVIISRFEPGGLVHLWQHRLRPLIRSA